MFCAAHWQWRGTEEQLQITNYEFQISNFKFLILKIYSVIKYKGAI